MAEILRFERSLDGRETRITRIKYEALALACTQIGTAGHSHKVRKIIAQRIINAMEKGERDPAKLSILGIAALGPMITDPVKKGIGHPRTSTIPAE